MIKEASITKNCNICGKQSCLIFNEIVLKKYRVNYFKCQSCGQIETENPYWINEAYLSSININDTGYLERNIFLRNFLTVFLFLFFNKNGKFLDYGGGFGVFVRLMRDSGFDFYWQDKYTENLFSKGFEYSSLEKVELLTTFECFEHFENPAMELEGMLKLTDNVLFTTTLIPVPVPSKSWWYYGFSEGQHISFFTQESLRVLANSNGCYFYTYKNVHLITKNKKFKSLGLKIAYWLCRLGVGSYIKYFRNSKIQEDYNFLSGR